MNPSIAALIRVLDDEHEDRTVAERNVRDLELKLKDTTSALDHLDADLDRLRERHAEEIAGLTERLEYQFDRNRELMLQNSDLRHEITLGLGRVNENLQASYDRMYIAVMSTATKWVVEPLYNEDPLNYAVNKIPFIKEIRNRSGLGLKESKDLADRFLAGLEPEYPGAETSNTD